MDSKLRSLVRNRAGNRCEYCRIHQDDDAVFSFHVEHIIPTKHGGEDSLDNLALACQPCNLHKGPNLSGIDPDEGKVVELFNPRRDVWVEHFSFEGPVIVGITASGRATVRVLCICLLYTSPSPRDATLSRMPSSA